MTSAIHETPLTLPHPAFPKADWGDTFTVHTERQFPDAEHAAQAIMASLPAWASGLMSLRDRLVAPLGLKTGKAMLADRDIECVGIFPVLDKSPDQIILGADDNHLDFRVVIDLLPGDPAQRVQLSTLVKRNNALGVGYLAVIMPFHKMIAKAMLRGLK